MKMDVRFRDGRSPRRVPKSWFVGVIEKVLVPQLTNRGFTSILVNVIGGGGRSRPRQEDGVFYINVYAKAHDRDEVFSTPKNMFGVRGHLCNDPLMLSVSGGGMFIVDPKSGYPVAEVIGNNLFILFDADSTCEHFPQAVWEEVLTKIFQEAVSYLPIGLPSLQEVQSKTYQTPEAKELRAIKEKGRQAAQEIENSVPRILKMENELKDEGALTGEYDRILNQLLAIPEIKDISIDGMTLTLHTHTMYAVHPETKKIHEFGEFKMDLTFGVDRTAEMRNMTRRPNLFGHPHVDRDRHWCFGEGEGVLTLLKSFEYEAAVLFALKAIESVNPSRDYTRILDLFPIVEKQMRYPTEKKTPSEELRKAFASLNGSRRERGLREVREQVEGLYRQVDNAQRLVAQGRFATLLASHNDTAPTVLKDQVEKVRALQNVRSVRIVDDGLHIETGNLSATDVSAGGRKYNIGQFTIIFDPRYGLKRLEGTRPRRVGNAGVSYAPQLRAKDSLIPAGQLSRMFPELIGNMHFDTATEVLLGFLQEFDGTTGSSVRAEYWLN